MPAPERARRTPPDRLDLAVAVLGDCAGEHTRPRDVLAERFRTLALSDSERHRVARAVYRALQQQRRTSFALDGLERLSREERSAALLIATLLIDGELGVEGAGERMRRFGRSRIDWRRVAAVDARIAAIEDPVQRFGLRHSMPDWLARRFLAEFGADAEPLAIALAAEPPRTIRANLLRVQSRDALAERLAADGVGTRPTRHAPHGLHVDDDVSLFDLPAFREGLFEQQDEASQLCAVVVAPPPRGRVLDACAGSGGKSLAIAAGMGNRGELLAVDINDRRLEELVQRRRRARVDVVRSLVTPAEAWPAAIAEFARRADRILLDVPCSGVGSWRRRTEARHELTPASCEALRGIQRELLARAAAGLAPGARIVYATCTVFADENEAQVEAALASHPGLELVRVAEVLGSAAAGPVTDPSGTFLKLAPHRHGCDGFFAAILRRRRAR